MKMYKVSSMLLACAALLAAQEKITVPLSNASQPVTVKIHHMNGSITVTAGPAGQVIVDAAKSAGREDRIPSNVPPGMKRIDMGRGGLDVTEDHNVVTINAGPPGMGGNIAVQVPANASLQLKTVNGGSVEVTGISGEI